MSKKSIFKKIVSAVAVMAMSVGVLSGCGSKSEATGTTTAAAKTDDKFVVAYISSCPFEDGGWGSNCYAGFKESAKKFEGIQTFEVENVALENMTSSVKQYCDAGVDLVISPDVDLSDAISEVAPNYPNVKFAVIDGTYTADNAMSMSQDNAQIGFVVGAIAALQTKTNSIGFVGGVESGEILKASQTMEAGAKYVNKDITYTSVMSGSWTDVAKGKEIGLSLISQNKADVIFSFASGVDSGVRQACMEQGAYFIAQPDDAMSQAPDITITSILQSNEQLIYLAMDAVAKNTFKGGFVKYGFKENETCSIGAYNEFFDADKQAKVKEIVDKVVSGEIDVYSFVK